VRTRSAASHISFGREARVSRKWPVFDGNFRQDDLLLKRYNGQAKEADFPDRSVRTSAAALRPRNSLGEE
jgi:hypothetical protein